MPSNRRAFLKSSAVFALGMSGLKHYVAAGEPTLESQYSRFGQIVPDPHNILSLPAGFDYRIISHTGDQMDDGLLVPDKPDGMAAFAGPNGLTLLVRNHEIEPRQQGPFGWGSELIDKIDRELLYDLGEEGKPCNAGTTTVVYDTRNQRVVRQYLSLCGTIRNCAGGPTSRGTWITCEEACDVVGKNKIDDGPEITCQQNHGYNFEVPASADIRLAPAIPLKQMGRFRHEAVAEDPHTGIVYQTEDLEDGLIYRYLPKRPGDLAAGGKLQALALIHLSSADTRNWNGDSTFTPGLRHAVRWIDLDDVESPNDDLRYQGFDAGAARFARGEGMWYADGEVYFACTNGGAAELGQIWKYTPSPSEGMPGEVADRGMLELFVEPNDSNLVANADNLTSSPWGDLIVCEDRDGQEVRLVGVTPDGHCYTFAHNHVHTEFSGATFSPDGTTLFVNLQHKGMTLAITGPWPRSV
ncbi:PhoX family protein [Aeoliella sp. ICT_H6.2]|uniref:PhoX family protein n=1 Tax=Aeoliella straminimaris TaxID=2954799 RepID=A0A9X2JGT2_9BACT|nr:alkaline phosphatase PhoX [Aeoliella straminimaris]MCO6043903.1 PhoX family protein [Aeoliella straminimaris]